MQESQWDQYLDRLVAETRNSIEKFASEHSEEEICYFAYDSEPCYGYVLTCFNTTDSSLASTRRQHAHHTEYRRKLMENPTWFNHAFYRAKANAVLPFCNSTGDFAYQGYTEILFPEWQEFAESPQYPKPKNDDDDYLLNRVARLFCRATDCLIQQGAFDRLRLARPTMIGFNFHDHPSCVLHLLRLPE